MPNPRGKTEPPEFYFDNRTGDYLLRQCPTRFQRLDKSSMIAQFRLAEIQVDREDDFGLKDGIRMLALCQKHRAVDYAGPLAGHKCGLLKTRAGSQILVSHEASPVAPVRGQWPKLKGFFSDLLGDQLLHFLYWLRVGFCDLREHRCTPGQLAVFAGPAGCGKSLTQDLITELFGGRSAEPFRFMTGQTAFNADLAGAEHHVIGDEPAFSNDIRSRRSFGESVKRACTIMEMSIHAKGKNAELPVPTFRRLSMSVNNEPENLAKLPPFDDSIMDKICLYNCSMARVGSDRARVWRELTAELPALAWQLTRTTIPADWQDDRFGVRAYHDPELLEVVLEISPEARLLSLIDETLFGGTPPRGEWQGMAIQLEKELRSTALSFAAEKLLSFSGACGTYLSRLQKKFPSRFTSSKSGGKTTWRIQA